MSRQDYDNDFFDDASYANGQSDDRRYDSRYDQPQRQPQRQSIFSSYFSKKSKRQTEGTLRSFWGNYGVDTIKADSEYNGYQEDTYQDTSYQDNTYQDNISDYNFNSTGQSLSAGVEKQVANLTYVDSPKPLYDPYNSTAGKVSSPGGMIVPVMLDINTMNQSTSNYSAPIPNIISPPNYYDAPVVQKPRDQKREKRIQELKNEISDLDHKLEMDQKAERQRAKRCCCCLPATKRVKIIVTIFVFGILCILGLLLYFFFPKVPSFKVKNLQVFRGVSPEINITEDGSYFRLTYALNLTVEVTNNNRYDIKTDQISMNAYISPNITELAKTNYPGHLLTGRVDDHLVGEAKVTNVQFKAASTRVFYAKLEIDFSPDPELGVLNDPAIGEIIRVCTPDARKRKELVKIIYQVDIKIGLFTKFGFTPKILDEVSVGCPLGDTNADKLFKQPVFSIFLNNTQK